MGIDELALLEQTGISVETGGHSTTLLDGSDIVVLSPGVDPASGPAAAALERGLKVVSEIEVASWFFEGEIVGITGSNGKSTVTAMAAEMLSAGGVKTVPGGNLGRAFSSIVDEEEGIEVVVLELSSFQLEQIDTFRAGTGVVLNVTPDHLDRYPRFEAYEAAKARLWEGQKDDDWAIYGADDPGAVRSVQGAPGTRLPFTLGQRPGESGGWIEKGKGVEEGMASIPGDPGPLPLFTSGDLALPGPHNLSNALAASLVARRFQVGAEAIREAVKCFKGLPHRMELVAQSEGIRFFDDSKATNVESAKAALSSFSSNVVLIAGGKHKGSSYLPLKEELLRCGKAAVLIGESGRLMKEELKGSVPLYEEKSLESAVMKACRLAKPEGVVLLAPACSSFDMFDNYVERGEVFQKSVLALLEGRKGV
jgi:UDP-N-acetylmuramoylalanine--D-glutamate ligase